MLSGTIDNDKLPGFTNLFGRFNFKISPQIFSGKAFFIFNDGFIIACCNHFTAEVTGQRTHINNMICFPHHHFIMLHHHNGIAQVAQLFKHVDQTPGIPGMQVR